MTFLKFDPKEKHPPEFGDSHDFLCTATLRLTFDFD